MGFFIIESPFPFAIIRIASRTTPILRAFDRNDTFFVRSSCENFQSTKHTYFLLQLAHEKLDTDTHTHGEDEYSKLIKKNLIKYNRDENDNF